MFVCVCKGLPEAALRAAIVCGLPFTMIVRALKDNSGCCKCLPRVKEMYDEERKDSTSSG